MRSTKRGKPPSKTGSGKANSTICVRVLLFSVLREAVGWQERTMTLPLPATGADLLDELEHRHPALAEHRPLIRLAVNEQYAEDDVSLSEDDEVALITPVSGG